MFRILFSLMTITIMLVLLAIPCTAEERTAPNLEYAGSWPYGYAKAVDLDLDRNLVYLGSGAAALVLDVSNVTDPLLVSESIRTKGFVQDMEYDPVTQRLYIAAGEGGLEIWDLSNAASPQFLGSVEVYYANVEAPVVALGIQNNFAYVASDWGHAHWIDATDPTQPVVVGGGGAGNPTVDMFVVDVTVCVCRRAAISTTPYSARRNSHQVRLS